tara:strand:- start:5993 stop:6103 length:111 start_codon:yes stop_codon:yes gene_type:complete
VLTADKRVEVVPEVTKPPTKKILNNIPVKEKTMLAL